MAQQNKQFPTSLISSLYSAWQQKKIPAIYYHYTLAILAKKEKKEQIGIMQREIKQLQTGNHIYHTITNALEARERSLDIIKRNVHILMQNQSAVSISWANQEQEVESQGYSLIFQSRGVERRDNRTLIELINHLRLYQKVTYQVITSINNWQEQLVRQGYIDPIQFLYKHEDYLQKILKDTREITDQYPQLFENNPFLLFKKEHQTSEFSLIYQNLKFGPDFAAKIAEALQIISNHDVSIERHRILGNYKQYGTRKKIMKSESLHKIYCNYNNNKDFLIVKDHLLKADRLSINPNSNFKFMNNRNVLFNPEITPPRYIQKRHPVYIKNQVEKEVKVKTEQVPLSRSSSLNEFQVRKINHRQSLVFTADKLNPSHHIEKIMEKKLSLYEELDKTVKYKPIKMHEPIIKHKIIEPPQLQNKATLENMEVQTVQDILQEQNIESQLHFSYQTAVSPYDLLKYLRENAFKNKQVSLRDLELIAKKVISQKEYITFFKVTAGQHIAAWLAIKFLTKDISIRKTVQIIFSYKFFKIPNFQEQLIEQFMKKGYGLIKQHGRIVHEVEINEKLSHQAIKIKYKVSSNVEQSELKAVIKKNECLKESRILKYHHYSKQSKYHKYCEHTDSYCQIGYDFEQAFKINISGTNYIRLRCDSIIKTGNCFKASHHLNNTELLIGTELDDILQFSSREDIEFNSSFEDQSQQKLTYLCIPECKIMHKYMNLTQKPLIVEYLTINGDLPQVLSISADKKLSKQYLIMQRSFVIGIICKNKEDFGKFISILMFN